jgi:hypothetical protein
MISTIYRSRNTEVTVTRCTQKKLWRLLSSVHKWVTTKYVNIKILYKEKLKSINAIIQIGHTNFVSMDIHMLAGMAGSVHLLAARWKIWIQLWAEKEFIHAPLGWDQLWVLSSLIDNGYRGQSGRSMKVIINFHLPSAINSWNCTCSRLCAFLNAL